jgi:hypothetical protein
MIYVRLAGGLGNQLFQICAAMLLSHRTGMAVTPLTGALDRYQAKREPDSLRLLHSTRLMPNVGKASLTSIEWLALGARVGRWPIPHAINDDNFWRKLQGARNLPKRVFVDGYFQNRWDDALMREATSELHCTETSVPVSDTGEQCVIHIRGGDFLTTPSYQVVDQWFYVRAVTLAKAEGFRRFLILTDDVSYAKEIEAKLLIEHPDIDSQVVHPQQDALADFQLLMRASARIIGNSTFGWWASAMDVKRAPTWSPDQFRKGVMRDSVLSHERVLAA